MGATVPPLENGAAELHGGAHTLANRLTQWLDAQPWLADGLVTPLALLLLLLGLVVLAWLLYVVARPLLLRWMKALVHRTPFSWDEDLFGHGVFRWASHFVPALMIQAMAPGLFAEAPVLEKILVVGSRIYMVVAGYFVLDSLLNAGRAIYRRTDLSQKFQINTFVQVAKLLAALVAVLMAIVILTGQSPVVLLGGLGVFASVLMLVFKDVVLGFVAGIQLASNRMLSPGDWLEMPSHKADGDVEQIGLTTVKVRNWDKTITTIPTYALITEPFKNWRGMSESGGRRIKRSLLVDVSSIRLCDEAMLKRFGEIEHIGAHIRKKEAEVHAWNKEHGVIDDPNRVNGRRLTNVGSFRAYIEAYLRNHPDISQEMTLLVRQLAPTGEGLPIELYCFSTNKNWAAYEGIQADIFDHLLAVAPEFDLRVFQHPSGVDLREALQSLSKRQEQN
ncbi:MAG: mechanosensitive ion channel family protein [Roseibacillus sp.]